MLRKVANVPVLIGRFQNGKPMKPFQIFANRKGEEVEEKIDWTNVWGKKYPILLKYQANVNIANYARRINIKI